MMTTDIDPARSPTRNRFGQLSKNMFFARHVAQPKYLKFICGPGGQRICHVREEPLQIPTPSNPDYMTSILSDPRFQFDLPINTHGDLLNRLYADRVHVRKRRERLLPPIPGWSPSGTVVDDTEHWRREIAHIGEMVGLMTSDELVEVDQRKQPPLTPISKSRPSSGQYSRQTGRWNETPKTSQRARSARRRTPLSSSPTRLFCVDEHEREIWMLQVLCQILQTDSVNEIQSWLVSSGPSARLFRTNNISNSHQNLNDLILNQSCDDKIHRQRTWRPYDVLLIRKEKEAVRQLITTAIKGLEENGRVQSASQNENSKGVQVNMDMLGSLLAHRFPQVSTLITPQETQPRPVSRPKTTGSQKSVVVESKTEITTTKLVAASPTNRLPIDVDGDEKITNTEIIEESISSPMLNIPHAAQVLTIDENDKSEQLDTAESHDQAPF